MGTFSPGERLDQADSTLLAPSGGEEIVADGPYAAASAILIESSLRLAKIRGDQDLRDRSLSALNRGQQYIQAAPFWYVSQLGAIRLALAEDD